MARSRSSRVKAITLGSLVANLFLKHWTASLALLNKLINMVGSYWSALELISVQTWVLRLWSGRDRSELVASSIKVAIFEF